MVAYNGALYLPATQDPFVAVETVMSMNGKTDEGVSQVSVLESLAGDSQGMV